MVKSWIQTLSFPFQLVHFVVDNCIKMSKMIDMGIQDLRCKLSYKMNPLQGFSDPP